MYEIIYFAISSRAVLGHNWDYVPIFALCDFDNMLWRVGKWTVAIYGLLRHGTQLSTSLQPKHSNI